eukprot:PhF_6_TR4415/c0_g1_i2/m.5966
MQYRISSTVWRESLNGTRVRGLLHTPPKINYTKSSTLKLPTLEDERHVDLSGWQFQSPHMFQATPLNMDHVPRMQLLSIRQQDLHSRHVRKENTPDSAMVWNPMASMKPLTDGFAQQRGMGFRNWDKQVVGERLGGRGFGWKKKMRYNWNLSNFMKG